jgi:GcrA cell cycle regulator
MSWTDERVALLKKLWSEGKTAAEIAQLLGGITRNAVIGKAHRLRLSGRVSPIQQNTRPQTVVARAKSQEPRAQKIPMRETSPPPVIDDFVPGEGVDLVDLKERMCRWPIGDPKDANFKFCGCESIEGLPYCEHHSRIAFQINTKPKLKIRDLERIDHDVIRKVVGA